MGYLTSILFSFNDAQLMGIVQVLIFCMVGGTTPTLKTVESTLPGTIAAASSFARWMSESFVGRELQTYPQSRKEEADLLMEHFGYKYANVWPALGWLALIGVIFRLLSLILCCSSRIVISKHMISIYPGRRCIAAICLSCMLPVL